MGVRGTLMVLSKIIAVNLWLHCASLILLIIVSQAVHNQEVDKLGGEAKDIKPFDLKEGGSDVLVQVTNFHSGWTTRLGDDKVALQSNILPFLLFPLLDLVC